MRNFYCPDQPFTPDCTVELPAAESTHALRVLRLQAGDRLQLLNGSGIRAEAELLPPTNAGRRQQEAHCRIIAVEHCPEPAIALHLYIAPPRGKNMDAVLRTATELGVKRITPILCRYGVAKPENDKDSWQQTLIAACKQSGNPFQPAISPLQTFHDALAGHDAAAGFFGAVPRDNDQPIRPGERPAPHSVSLWIGPEGGFSLEENEALHTAGLRALTIGPWILRVETAVPALLGALYGLLEH
ncbi:MAG: RsmE family RNA methyltransferase [Lentisphaeria bacterium]|nr:RsmE family RNA methyltransferase [Lentisphaeria bacterium]